LDLAALDLLDAPSDLLGPGVVDLIAVHVLLVIEASEQYPGDLRTPPGREGEVVRDQLRVGHSESLARVAPRVDRVPGDVARLIFETEVLSVRRHNGRLDQ